MCVVNQTVTDAVTVPDLVFPNCYLYDKDNWPLQLHTKFDCMVG